MRIRRILTIAALVYAAYIAEFVLYNAFGSWGRPELMVLVVIFCNLYWGVRFSIWAAFVAGVLKDSFGIEIFGTYIVIYVAAAYCATFIRLHWYQPGSKSSRLLLTFFVLFIIFAMEVMLHMRLFDVRLREAVVYIFLPQLTLSLFIATFLYQGLRDLAVRFKI